jgi:hypothetical protein
MTGEKEKKDINPITQPNRVVDNKLIKVLFFDALGILIFPFGDFSGKGREGLGLAREREGN